MTNDIQIFKSDEFGSVRTLTIGGEPWFVGKDVAEVLGYAKPLNALSVHVDGDDSLKQGLTDSMGRVQDTILINESGLYSLILSSKLPTAKKFKHWVTSEVLPSIRKTGGYTVPKTFSEALIAYAKEVEAREKLELDIVKLRLFFHEVEDREGVYTSNIVKVSKMGIPVPFEVLQEGQSWTVHWLD